MTVTFLLQSPVPLEVSEKEERKKKTSFHSRLISPFPPVVDPTNYTQVFTQLNSTFQSLRCNQNLLYAGATNLLPSSVLDANSSLCLSSGLFCNWEGLLFSVPLVFNDVTLLETLPRPTLRNQQQCENVPWLQSNYCYDPTECDREVLGACPEVCSFFLLLMIICSELNFPFPYCAGGGGFIRWVFWII